MVMTVIAIDLHNSTKDSDT